MSIERFKQGLVELYQGELLGEVVFEQLLGFFTEPEQQAKLGALLQLETETKARLRPALVELGLPLTEQNNSRQQGLDLANALQHSTWEQAMAVIRDAVAPFVDHYRQIAASAPSQYAELAESMVLHEQALLDFAELELAGERDNSIKAVTAQLHFKLHSC
jgi:tryptophan 2,3-dioxygenase